MKKLYVLAVAGLSLAQTYAQDFPGFRTGNYSGVNGVFYNPANVADSRYRFDINLFSLSTLVANDQASFKLSTISDNFKGDSVKNQIFGKDAGPTSGIMNVDILGPSVMFNIGKKHSFAITSRARIFANVTDLDGKLFDKISEDFNNDPSLPYTISSGEKMSIAINGWSEFGVSYGRVITEKGPHFLKGGITLKYLAGAGNAYMNIDNFNGTIDDNILLQDVYLQNTTGRVATGFGGTSFSDFDAGDLMNMESSGFGADLGFVYEFRPLGKNYKLKLGAALLDLGSIKYEKDMQRSGGYDINITGNERFSLRELDGVDFDDLNALFASYPEYFTPSASNSQKTYKVSLPSTLQLTADYHVISGLYLNMAGQFSLSSNESKAFNNKTYGSLTLTPRFEMKRFGFYLPLNYNKLSELNVGASMRIGPFFMGSGSLLSALLGNSKQADMHFGFRFGMLK